MRNLPRALPVAFAGILVASAAHAQTPPAPPPPGAPAPTADAAPPPPPPPNQAGLDADAPPPPPPPGALGLRPPPPPRGAAFMIDRGPNGVLRVDVKCAERDTTRDCAEITTQFIDKLNAEAKAR